jgi:hypothetical protein
MKRIALVTVALVVATSASAQHSYGRQECKGVLLQDPDGNLSIQVPPEGLCEISPSQQSKVLATCTPGRFCRVKGMAEDCKDSSECQEITRVLLVRRR